MERFSASSTCLILMVLLALATAAQADVFNMGGTQNADGTWTGLASLEIVTVGNPGNAGELSGEGAGGWGPDAIVGAVSSSLFERSFALHLFNNH